MKLFKRSYPFRKRDCPHMHIRDIYSDEINTANARSQCMDCGRFYKRLGGKD